MDYCSYDSPPPQASESLAGQQQHLLTVASSCPDANANVAEGQRFNNRRNAAALIVPNGALIPNAPLLVVQHENPLAIDKHRILSGTHIYSGPSGASVGLSHSAEPSDEPPKRQRIEPNATGFICDFTSTVGDVCMDSEENIDEEAHIEDLDSFVGYSAVY